MLQKKLGSIEGVNELIEDKETGELIAIEGSEK
jgi:hypothetical protein